MFTLDFIFLICFSIFSPCDSSLDHYEMPITVENWGQTPVKRAKSGRVVGAELERLHFRYIYLE